MNSFTTRSKCRSWTITCAAYRARLSSSVEADAQGGYWAIDRLRKTLDSLFAVRDLSSASGDQEKELHVLLESR
ncbi:hypothetical protein [Streptomyces aurantiogriseus]